LDEVERDLRAAAPTAPRLHVLVLDPEDQLGLLAEASAAGGRLSFDHVLVAGDRSDPDADPARVEEIAVGDAGFGDAYRATSALFGIDDPATLEELVAMEERVLAPHGKRWFVVRDERGAVAAMAALVPGPAAEIDHVATVPAARGRGHARALVARCVAEARAAGTDVVFLLAEPDGPAERIYRRGGFRPIATFAGWVRPASPAGTAEPT
ncbi:MAG: GNAT family N-acetyltransferase, partial [Actinomycetota bacterium]